MAKKRSQRPAKKKVVRKKAPAKRKVLAVPAGYHTVTPYLIVRGAAGAIEFYKKAFGAKEKGRMATPDGGVAHAEIVIGDSRLMLSDENPQMGALAPQSSGGGTPIHVFLYVKDIDRLYQQAVAAGASAVMPPTDMFWGDRYGKLDDPFGHRWSIATHIEDVSPKEMGRRAAKEFAPQG
jgi:PhnB protein